MHLLTYINTPVYNFLFRRICVCIFCFTLIHFFTSILVCFCYCFYYLYEKVTRASHSASTNCPLHLAYPIASTAIKTPTARYADEISVSAKKHAHVQANTHICKCNSCTQFVLLFACKQFERLWSCKRSAFYEIIYMPLTYNTHTHRWYLFT